MRGTRQEACKLEAADRIVPVGTRASTYLTFKLIFLGVQLLYTAV